MHKSFRRKEKILATGMGYVLDATPKARSLRAKKMVLAIIKLKIASLKDSVKRLRNKVTDWKEIFTQLTSDKGPRSTLYKDF